MESVHQLSNTTGSDHMISETELKKIAQQTGLTLYQQEKDYLLKLFLYYYYNTFEDAVFKGGTCLKFIYGLPRFSEDLDFNISISPDLFKEQTHQILRKIKQTGLHPHFIKEEQFAQAYTCEIGIHGPLYKNTKVSRNKIRIDAGKRIGTIQPTTWKIITSEYPETKQHFLVKTMSEEELLIEKIIALMNRDKGRDLYDVWFLLEKGIKPNKTLFEQKTKSSFSMDLVPTEKTYLRDITKLTTRIIPYEQLIKRVKQDLLLHDMVT
jgi:uncharacterized protein